MPPCTALVQVTAARAEPRAPARANLFAQGVTSVDGARPAQGAEGGSFWRGRTPLSTGFVVLYSFRWTVRPPSMVRTWPVMVSASSRRKATARAISVAPPSRPRRVRAS